MTVELLLGDCLETLKTLPDCSVQTCVTSPPYFGLRDYGVEGQIGLEETPEAYVAKLVAVFREVRRVLKDDGTLWLVIGDSYTPQSTHKAAPGTRGGFNSRSHDLKDRIDIPAYGKQKDLMGIPWMVAFALRQPYYSGRIKSELDRIWLASIIDGEGCIFIHKRRAGQNNGQGYQRQNDSYSACIEVANTHESIVLHCKELTGQGSITHQDKETKSKYRNLRLYRWHLQSREAKELLREIYPFLIAKKKEARLALGCPSSGEEASATHIGLMQLHNGAETTIDYPEPASMFEKGFYLRSDVIWSKPNPMPESVTDRPTKSHEYIFLLTKSARYYYDADAIKEPSNCSGDPRAGYGRLHYRGKREGIAGTGNENFVLITETRNKRDVWTVTTKPYKEAHFATFPPDLIEPCILAGSRVGDTVLDPFNGSGTTGEVSIKHRRNYIGLELKPDYIELTKKRLAKVQPVLMET